MTKYIIRSLFVALIVSTVMTMFRHGVLDRAVDMTPSFSSLHLPQFSKTVSAAVEGNPGSFHYCPNENLEPLDVEAINSAEGHLDIAMYSFTDHAIADAVVDAARRGLRVRIYRDREQYAEEQNRDPYVPQALASNQNISVRVKNGRELMHLKEWSDGVHLREGSANWSNSGERRQDNSVAFYDDRRAADAFERKFEEMWDRPGNTRVQ